MKYYKLGVIGFGNIATTICKGAIDGSVCAAGDICVYDIDAEKAANACKYGFAVCDSVKELAEKSAFILLSIKPQNAGTVFAALKPYIADNAIISVMAGVKKGKIAVALSTEKVCRCMPNTPALISKGITAIDSSSLAETEKKFVYDLFNCVGETVEIGEQYLNAVTAVSGSGPAFVYLFIKYYIEAAKNLGLSEDTARRLTLATVTGAAEMVKRGEKDIDTLIDSVCSKGGTTIEGVNALRNGGLGALIDDCIKAAHKRAEELSKNQ